jgi:glycosyltransferase involved in cell wall biosynthesis
MARSAKTVQTSYCVGLNAHLLSLAGNYRGAGINGYILQLLRHLPEADPGLAFTAYYHDEVFRPPAGVTGSRSRWDTRNPWRRIAWEQMRLPLLARGQDLLHGLAFAGPLASTCPTVVTVHDLSFMRFPAAFRPFNRIYLKWITRLSTRGAARVIAVSESTRQDVIGFCGVPDSRVTVVPNGVTEDFSPASPAEVAAFRAARDLPERFVLYLGTLEPRKNLARLVDAYADWQQPAGRPVKLVIAGARGWYYEEIFARVAERKITGDVLFAGFVPAEELPWWYRSAELFIYPSLFEGFGLPVLEAMASGTPVITSTTSSLPEVAGDAALLVNPLDTSALTAAIDQVMSTPQCAAQLRAMGLQRAASFSWQQTACATARLYRSVLEGPHEG